MWQRTYAVDAPNVSRNFLGNSPICFFWTWVIGYQLVDNTLRHH